MKSKLQVFQNEEFGKVRVVEINGEPWWVLRDVCAALGLNSPHKVAERLDDDEKGRNQIPTPGGRQEVAVVSESGLYAVILRSDKPKARAFRRWVTSQVLPSIRKTGVYATEGALRQALNQAELERDMSSFLLDDSLRQSKILKDNITLLEPKARYYDDVLSCKDIVPVSVIAKDYGMSAVAFNKLLHGLGIQYKAGKTWLLYQPHAGEGYTRTSTYQVADHIAVIQTYWTQKGRQFLYEKLKDCGLIPFMEIYDRLHSH